MKEEPDGSKPQSPDYSPSGYRCKDPDDDPKMDLLDNPHDNGDPPNLHPDTNKDLIAKNLDAHSSNDLQDPQTGVTPEEETSCCRVCPKFCKLNKGTTTPDYKYIGLMFAALFSSSFTLTFLFPFLPDMVKWLGYSEEEKGYYVGLIASSVFAGRACGSFFWGWLSDIKGRKLVLLLTIAGNGIFSVLFGLSLNLPMAMFLRFMAGLANGTVGTAKTVLYEISDNTNQAIGMSAISLAWGCGLIMGPTVGGYLATPAIKYPSVFSSEGFFGDYPFFLPSLVTLFVCCIGFFIIFFKFEETLQKKDFVLDVTENDEAKPLTDQGSISANQINVCRSIESLNRGPMASMSIEDVHCAAETEGYFAHFEEEEDSKLTNESLSQENITSQNGDTCLIQRKGLDVKNRLEKHESFESESERTILLNENAVRTFFSPCKNISTASLNGSVVSATQSVPRSGNMHTKDKTASQNGRVNDKHVVQHCNGGCEGSIKEDSVTIVVECQMSSIKVNSQSKPRSLSSCCSCVCRSIRESKLVSLLCDRDIRNSIFLYTVFSFGVIGSEDVFTIFLSTEPRYNGLGFTSNEIGLSLGVVSVPLLVLQLVVFPAMVKYLGIKKTFLIGGVVLVITVQTLAMLNPLHDNPVVLWTLLILILLPERLSVNCCFSGASLMINNSSNPQNAGTVNGIAMTCTAIARTLAPTIGGSIFAWSISYGTDHLGPPFDHNLAFILFGLIFFISVIQCLFLPESLNKQTKKS